MPYYAVQMTGIHWDSHMEGDEPVVVVADTAHDAILQAMRMTRIRRRVRSEVVTLNVARMDILGMGSWSMGADGRENVSIGNISEPEHDDTGNVNRMDTSGDFIDMNVFRPRGPEIYDLVDAHVDAQEFKPTPTGKRDIRL